MTLLLAALIALGSVGSSLQAGVATWYDDGPGLYGAVPSYRWGDPTYLVDVCTDTRCVTVEVRDYCACADRPGGSTVIDLSPEAFSRLAPLSAGVIAVTVEGRDAISLPATDTE